MEVAVVSNPPSPPPPSDPELPALDPEIVEDDEALGEAVDRFIANNPEGRQRLHRIAFQQDCVRQIVDAGTWTVVLRMDEAIVERWADLAVEIARWAFNEGAKSAGRPRGTT